MLIIVFLLIAFAIGILLAACIAVTSASMYMGEEPPFSEDDQDCNIHSS